MDDATRDVIIFPGTGSFGSEFQPMVRTLRPNVRILRYPWRYEQTSHTDTPSFHDAAVSFVPQLRDISEKEPILFGHSFGAYMAYTLAAALELACCQIGGLVIVGANAPHLIDGSALLPRSSEEIEAYWTTVDPGLFERMPSHEWKDILIDTTRKELNMLSDFHASDFGRLCCPIFAASGDEDPLVTENGLTGWGDYTTERMSIRRFCGGHTNLLATNEFITWVKEITHH
ncbi:thioesterase II family protein [Desulfoluna spongiiphila]|uniref:Surfactin synthase thioesterase subunit n=1 Tax=Desulfoluna spongiiphila TaxID=419481 RepID=A0A1G5BMV6_9BACT|nr:alpha/beta fold hydrolase [Desulfoluna spongiiphila]SCX91562.1 Surfactin synthase thioesterase subunit [Desulfoluna spongiiphila]VVS93825.1 alpha/beta hydrolase fold [Desulfoluna spongiiphila]